MDPISWLDKYQNGIMNYKEQKIIPNVTLDEIATNASKNIIDTGVIEHFKNKKDIINYLIFFLMILLLFKYYM